MYEENSGNCISNLHLSLNLLIKLYEMFIDSLELFSASSSEACETSIYEVECNKLSEALSSDNKYTFKSPCEN